jgi:hypothetical protein
MATEETMKPESRSRRSILAAAAAGAAGLAAAQIARPGPAAAVTGGNLILGNPNTAHAAREVNTTVADVNAFKASASGIGTGLEGAATDGIGVRAAATSGIGLTAFGDTALYGEANLGGTGLYVHVHDLADIGMEVQGAIRFRDRAKVAKVAAGKASVSVMVPGITASNVAIATLATNRPGHYVRAVVCSAGKITIYLNGSVPKLTKVAWLVLG